MLTAAGQAASSLSAAFETPASLTRGEFLIPDTLPGRPTSVWGVLEERNSVLMGWHRGGCLGLWGSELCTREPRGGSKEARPGWQAQAPLPLSPPSPSPPFPLRSWSSVSMSAKRARSLRLCAQPRGDCVRRRQVTIAPRAWCGDRTQTPWGEAGFCLECEATSSRFLTTCGSPQPCGPHVLGMAGGRAGEQRAPRSRSALPVTHPTPCGSPRALPSGPSELQVPSATLSPSRAPQMPPQLLLTSECTMSIG